MLADILGNTITGDEPQTLRGIDDFVSGLLGYEQQIANILAVADNAPNHCLANTYAAILWMLMESPEGPKTARQYIDKALTAAPLASRREQMSCQMVHAWRSGETQRALKIGAQIADEFPHDLTIVKLHQYLSFNGGDAPAMLRIANTVFEHNKAVPHMHGMAAFAFEQCHLLDDAQRCAETAINLKRKEPWAQHALAHIHLTRGDIAKGACFLESMRKTWVGLNSFMYTHNYWHLAIFYLAQGRGDDVLALYDHHCWGIEKTYSQDQIGAVSLLARLELAGVNVAERWSDIGQHLRSRANDTVLPFLSMQYLYGLARAGLSEADDLMAAVTARAKTCSAFERDAWQRVALPACTGLLAHAQGDHQRSVEHLGQALPHMMKIGGSHAQRDLFEQIMLDSLIKTGQLVYAQQMLEVRRAADPLNLPQNAALAQVYQRLDLPVQAAKVAEQSAV